MSPKGSVLRRIVCLRGRTKLGLRSGLNVQSLLCTFPTTGIEALVLEERLLNMQSNGSRMKVRLTMRQAMPLPGFHHWSHCLRKKAVDEQGRFRLYTAHRVAIKVFRYSYYLLEVVDWDWKLPSHSTEY